MLCHTFLSLFLLQPPSSITEFCGVVNQDRRRRKKSSLGKLLLKSNVLKGHWQRCHSGRMNWQNHFQAYQIMFHLSEYSCFTSVHQHKLGCQHPKENTALISPAQWAYLCISKCSPSPTFPPFFSLKVMPVLQSHIYLLLCYSSYNLFILSVVGCSSLFYSTFAIFPFILLTILQKNTLIIDG